MTHLSTISQFSTLLPKTSGDVLFPVSFSDIQVRDAEDISFTTVDPALPKALTSQEVTMNILYSTFEVAVAVLAVFGNALVIAAFKIEKVLRKRTNYYLVSLAAADLLVGLVAIPLSIIASVGVENGHHICLYARCIVVVLGAISIFGLAAVSADRYWAILHPISYSRNISTQITNGIIISCWVAGTFVGILPLFGWNTGPQSQCLFTKIMDRSYLVFLYFVVFIFPVLLLVVVYGLIYRVILQKVRRRTMAEPTNIENPENNKERKIKLRVLGPNQNREIKIAKKLAIIVFFFIFCWAPIHTANCVEVLNPKYYINGTVRYLFIILSHLNSAINPLLYAYHLKDFRTAFQDILMRCRKKQQPQPIVLHVNDDVPGGSNIDSSQKAVRSHINDNLVKTHDPIPSGTPVTSSTTAESIA